MSIPISIWTKIIKKTKVKPKKINKTLGLILDHRKGREVVFGGKERGRKSDPMGRKGRRGKGSYGFGGWGERGKREEEEGERKRELGFGDVLVWEK